LLAGKNLDQIQVQLQLQLFNPSFFHAIYSATTIIQTVIIHFCDIAAEPFLSHPFESVLNAGETSTTRFLAIPLMRGAGSLQAPHEFN
jgi:hypothetical protein